MTPTTDTDVAFCKPRSATALASGDVFLTIGSQAVLPELAAWPALQLSLDEGTSRLSLILDTRQDDSAAASSAHVGLTIHIRPVALDSWLPLEVRGSLQLTESYFGNEDIAATTHEILTRAPDGADRDLFLTARVLSLIWLVMAGLRSGALHPCGDGELCANDVRRLHVARRIIHERYGEPLALHDIAKASGLSRSKLTQGFRDHFKCSVGEALAERRLQQAAQGLRATDAPVSLVGYKVGYTSNAAFTRAFTRRFGEAPTAFRARRYQPSGVQALAAV